MVASNSADINSKVTKAREYGEHLASMLVASHFSVAEKEAWAFLVPGMTPEQLVRFDQLLQADMAALAGHEMQDLLVELKAAQHKRDLSLAALNEKTHQTLDALTQDIEDAA